MIDVTDYDANQLAKYINYLESHKQYEMYEIDDDVNTRYKTLELSRA